MMWLIAGVALVTLVLFFERLIALRRSRVCPSDFVDRVLKLVVGDESTGLLDEGEKDSENQVGKTLRLSANIEKAHLIAQEYSTPVSHIFRELLQSAQSHPIFLRESAEDGGRQVLSRLERNVSYLATLATISPLLGLLGTVTGMIAVFQQVALTGVGDPLDMAAGIWQALLTTAFGLCVAIPAYVAHRVLENTLEKRSLELEDASNRLIYALSTRK